MNNMFRRRLLFNNLNNDEPTDIYKEIQLNISSSKTYFSIQSICPELIDKMYRIGICMIGSGGNAGLKGDDFIWESGGSGGSGANGSIIDISGKIDYSKEYIIECDNPNINDRPRNFTLKDIDKTLCIAYAGGNGHNGKTAGFEGEYDAGKGGVGKPPFINLDNTVFKLTNSYYDIQGNNGTDFGGYDDIIIPNPLPSIHHSEFCLAGTASYDDSKIKGKEGGVFIEIYKDIIV